jgi:probable F420-dependent oxidoreductase
MRAIDDCYSYMGTRVTFGLLTDVRSGQDIAALEALPFEALWVGGHVASKNPSPEALMQLARLSAFTKRVRIGTSVLLLPLYPPAIVAKQVADLDRVTGGRIMLGVGVGGEYPQEFEACGIPMYERGARTDEAIPLLRRLWTGEKITHKGRYFSMADVRIQPAPAQKGGPPVIVAGRSSAAMRRAAVLGDGWVPYLYSPERYARSVDQVTRYAEEAGRDLSAGFLWTAFVFVTLADDGDTATRDAMAFFGATFAKDMRAFLDRVTVVGTSGEVVDRLNAFVAAGARHLVIAPATAGTAGPMIDRIAAEVIPKVRT